MSISISAGVGRGQRSGFVGAEGGIDQGWLDGGEEEYGGWMNE